MLVLDCTPETAGAPMLTALGGDAREDTDAEDASGPILQLLRELEGIAGAPLRLVHPA